MNTVKITKLNNHEIHSNFTIIGLSFAKKYTSRQTQTSVSSIPGSSTKEKLEITRKSAYLHGIRLDARYTNIETSRKSLLSLACAVSRIVCHIYLHSRVVSRGGCSAYNVDVRGVIELQPPPLNAAPQINSENNSSRCDYIAALKSDSRAYRRSTYSGTRWGNVCCCSGIGGCVYMGGNFQEDEIFVFSGCVMLLFLCREVKALCRDLDF